jgi:hypothetical protein
MKSRFKNIRASRPKWLTFANVLLLFLYAPSLYAQLRLGPQTLLHMGASIFRNPDYLSLALKRQKFSAAVGGVAFDQVAMHDEGVAVHQDCTPIEIIALGGQP